VPLGMKVRVNRVRKGVKKARHWPWSEKKFRQPSHRRITAGFWCRAGAASKPHFDTKMGRDAITRMGTVEKQGKRQKMRWKGGRRAFRTVVSRRGLKKMGSRHEGAGKRTTSALIGDSGSWENPLRVQSGEKKGETASIPRLGSGAGCHRKCRQPDRPV